MKLVRHYDGRRIYHFVDAEAGDTRSICDWCANNLSEDGDWFVFTPVINLRERWIRTGSHREDRQLRGDLMLITLDEDDATLIEINWGGLARLEYR